MGFPPESCLGTFFFGFDANEGELALPYTERRGRDGRSLRSGFFGGWQFAGGSRGGESRAGPVGDGGSTSELPSGSLAATTFFAAFNTEGQAVAKLAGAEQVLSDIAKAKTSAYRPAVDRKRKSAGTQVDAW